MSRCLNRATLIGYLGADPEIRTTPGGARVAQFSLATSRRWNDREGQPQEKTQWHRVVVWESQEGTFGFVGRYLRKGDRVYLEGEIDYRSYEDEKGITRWATEIKASDVLGAGEPSTSDGEESKRSVRRSSAVARSPRRRTSVRASAGLHGIQMSAL